MPNQTFSDRLTLQRKQKGVSQKQAAADLGISQALLSHYENGIREPGLQFLVKAADYYNVSCDYLLGHAANVLQLNQAVDFEDLPEDEELSRETFIRAAQASWVSPSSSNSLNASNSSTVILILSAAVMSSGEKLRKTGICSILRHLTGLGISISFPTYVNYNYMPIDDICQYNSYRFFRDTKKSLQGTSPADK